MARYVRGIGTADEDVMVFSEAEVSAAVQEGLVEQAQAAIEGLRQLRIPKQRCLDECARLQAQLPPELGPQGEFRTPCVDVCGHLRDDGQIPWYVWLGGLGALYVGWRLIR